MAKIKNRQRETVSVTGKIPLVSVIIPMYNSAKFITQTLESLCLQTMRDFEIVVVDDCSTDNSVEVVESFAERFSGRLHVIKLQKNSGAPGIPRNVGIQFAHGKYIAFLDSDDLFTPTALEELTAFAEKYQADVVRMNGRIYLWQRKKKYVDDPAMTDMAQLINPSNWSYEFEINMPQTPILESENFLDRVKRWIYPKTWWAICVLFCRRDFLITNQNLFPNMTTSEDAIFHFGCLCLAKKYLRVPKAFYVIRPHAGSVGREDERQLNLEKYLKKKVSSFCDGFNALETLMDKFKFFDEYPQYRYAVLDHFFQRNLSLSDLILPIYSKVQPFILNTFVKKEFSSDDASLAAYLFNTVNIQRLQLMQLQAENNALKKSLAQK